MDKYQNKYRIPSARAQWWDYGLEAIYFVTICTHNKEYHFGNISIDKMELSEIGKIVESEWQKTTELRPDMNLELYEYVVMPNHFHAIISIGKNQYNTDITHCRDAMLGVFMNPNTHSINTDAKHSVSTKIAVQNKFSPQSKNLSSIIRGFKSGVTINARKINLDFAWQTRFHDRIIRDYHEYRRIAHYIISNPEKWNEDKFFNSSPPPL